jgi:CRP/FNR family transcriptional regulator, cyclic AMP receptor protein
VRVAGTRARSHPAGSPPAGRLTTHPGLGYEPCMPTVSDSLASVPLFADLSGRQLRKIAKSAAEHRYEAGDVMIREGGRTPTLFVIVEGTAKVIRNGRTIARRSAGDVFGEFSMIDLRPRAATVTAETPMVCLVLHHDDVRGLVMEDPKMAWSLLETLAGRLRDTD